MEKVLDAGAFGQVCRCFDLRDGGKLVALKISSDASKDTLNARVEARLLKLILDKKGDANNLVKMLDNFPFRQFYVIVFEALDINLYRYIKAP